MFLLPLHVAWLTAPLIPESERGVFSVAPSLLDEADASLRTSGIPGVFLATCHRITVVWWGEHDGTAWLQGWLAARGAGAASGAVRTEQADLAVRHLMALASGLESPMVGEMEIHGQLRAAWRRARAAGVTNDEIDTTLSRVIEGARRIRAEMHAVRPTADLGWVLGELLVDHTADLGSAARLTVVGTGEVANAVLRALQELRPGVPISLVGRTPDRVRDVAAAHGATPHAWNDLAGVLRSSEGVVFAIRGTHPLDDGQLGHGPFPARVWIDVSMPSVLPVDDRLPLIKRLSDIASHSSDDEAVRAAGRKAIQHELARLAEQLNRRRMGRSIADVQARATEIVRTELAALMATQQLSEADLEVLGRRLARRVLHPALSLLAQDSA